MTNTARQTSFYNLIANDGISIEIPIIQRDYAQGRGTAKTVRTDFLSALHDYLKEGTPLRDLDFVYGHLDSNNLLTPLDGQQRLTTLFLLHWYCALKDDCYSRFKGAMQDGYKARFRYATRQSSSDFCFALIDRGESLAPIIKAGFSENKPKELSTSLTDSSWYHLSWRHDPSVQSMLVMLDAVHKEFGKDAGYYRKLADGDAPVITFQYLEMKDYGLTDDLYIKMNSRGKPLTPFETFKARYEKYLKEDCGHISIPANDKRSHRSIAAYFSHQIDTQWADFFWPFCKKDSKLFDMQRANLLATLAINQRATRLIPTEGPLKGDIDNQNALTLEYYKHRDVYNRIRTGEFISFTVELLDLLSTNQRFTAYLPASHPYKEQKTFETLINRHEDSDAAYHERILFFAYTAFLVLWKGDTAGLFDWMRVVCNLSEHTRPYNSDEVYGAAMRAVNKLLPHSNDILAHLTRLNVFSGFNATQVKEEIIKAHLLLRGEEWRTAIEEAESHPYFRGQLTFAIAFSGIEDYYDLHSNCSWEASEDSFLGPFHDYCAKVFSLIGTDGIFDSAAENHRLHRAILVKGDYLLYAKQNWSFLDNTDRDVSWKRFLQGDRGAKKRGLLKEVLDDERFNEEDLTSLEVIAADIPDNAERWQRTFLEAPGVFEYLGTHKWFRMEDDDQVYLLWGTRMNGPHSELYTCALYTQLQGQNFDIAPFASFKYEEVSGQYYSPGMRLFQYVPNGGSASLSITYKGKSAFVFTLTKRNPIATLVSDLEAAGFTEGTTGFQLVVAEDNAIKVLRSVCDALKKASG